MNINKLKNQYGSLLASKTMRSISILLSANILNGIVGFITSVMVLRYVDKEIIAVIYPLISVLMIIGQLGDLGLSNSFIKIASTHFLNDKLRSLQYFNAAFKLKLIFCLIVIIITIPMASMIAKWTFGLPIYVKWVKWILLITTFHIMSSYATSALQVEGKFMSLSISKVVPSLLKLILIGIVILFNSVSFPLIFWAFALTPMATLVIAFLYTDKDPFFKVKSTPAQFSELLHISKWIAISALSFAIMGQLDVLMTRSLAGIDEVNRLLGGQKLVGVFQVLTGSLATVLLPKISSMKTKKELNYFLRTTIKTILPMALFFLVCLPLSKFVIPFILGDKFKSSIEVFNIYILGSLITLIVIPLSLILYNLNKEPTLALINIIQLVFNIIGNVIFVPKNGAIAAAWVTTASQLIAVVIIYYELRKAGIINYHKELQSYAP